MLCLQRCIFALVICTLIASCADPDRVLFVTSTQIGIDGDGKTQSANIGYERYEGVLGPAYENGAAPPVYARLDSNLSIFDPKISQLYATGDAARLVTHQNPTLPPKKPLSGERRLMFFGTTTNFGLKTSFTPEGTASINLGYKRQEFSLIPIGKESQTRKKQGPAGSPDVYASVLGAFSLNTKTSSFLNQKVGISQFFATGDAAENLALQGPIQDLFDRQAEAALAAIDPTQDATLVDLKNCLASGKTNQSKIDGWIKSRQWQGKQQPTPLQFGSFAVYRDERSEFLRHGCS